MCVHIDLLPNSIPPHFHFLVQLKKKLQKNIIIYTVRVFVGDVVIDTEGAMCVCLCLCVCVACGCSYCLNNHSCLWLQCC